MVASLKSYILVGRGKLEANLVNRVYSRPVKTTQGDPNSKD